MTSLNSWGYRVEKKRIPPYKSCYLQPDIVKEIFLDKDKITAKEAMAKYELAKSTIYNIWNERTHTHITCELSK